MPSLAAAAWADFSFRDDIATISILALFIMPGRTFSMPILAVEITPHFTGFMIFPPHFLSVHLMA
jgi:hypothetical protein